MYPANERKFWQRVDKSNGCWLWTGATTPQGYGHGSWHINGQPVQLAHRVAYLLLVGPIPDGLVLDHLCRNPSCVDPAHLQPVTPWENTHGRGIHRNSLKAHCPQGHAYDYQSDRGDRGCKECRRDACRRYEAAHREIRAARKRALRQSRSLQSHGN